MKQLKFSVNCDTLGTKPSILWHIAGLLIVQEESITTSFIYETFIAVVEKNRLVALHVITKTHDMLLRETKVI